MTNLLPAAFFVGLGAVGAAAWAARNRIADKDGKAGSGGMFVFFRARRAQYSALGWRAMNFARVLLLLSFLILVVQMLIWSATFD